MKLIGKLYKGTRIIKKSEVSGKDTNRPFRDVLEECLIELCKQLDIPVPLWLSKNTSEFAMYRRTFFNDDQFIGKIEFDRFEIRIESL